MIRDEQFIACVIEAQVNGLSAYIRNLVELISALNKIIAIEEANGIPEAIRLQKVRGEMARQLDSSIEILDELERLKW